MMNKMYTLMLFSVSLGPLAPLHVLIPAHTVSGVYYASLGDDKGTSIYFLDPRIVLRHSHSSPWGEHSRESRVKVIHCSDCPSFYMGPHFHLCSVILQSIFVSQSVCTAHALAIIIIIIGSILIPALCVMHLYARCIISRRAVVCDQV